MKISAIQGDITQVDVDAIVFPAEEDKGLKRRIEDRLLEHAGAEVEQETVARGPLHVGDAILTSGGNLRCRYVIHAPMTAEDVRRSTLAGLRCAAGNRLRTVAIPAFPRGEQAMSALVSALLDFNLEGGLEEIFIVGRGEIVGTLEKRIGPDN